MGHRGHSRLAAATRQRLRRMSWAELRILIAAIAVGVVVGIVGVAFRRSVEVAHWARVALTEAFVSHTTAVLVSVGLSALGLTVAIVLVRTLAPEASGSGIHEIEGTLEGARPMRWKRVLPVKFIAATFSLGAGAAMGREGPTIHCGGASGKMVADWFKASSQHAHTLVAAGAAAGLASAFNAPIAAILFIVEEMRAQFKFSFLSLQAVALAAIVADIVTRALTSQAPVMLLPNYIEPPLETLWVYVPLGAVIGALGVVFNKAIILGLDFFAGFHGWKRHAAGPVVGAVVGLLAWYYPDAVGGGYHLLHESTFMEGGALALAALFLVRFSMTILCYGTGAPGGIFAPMLTLGMLVGLAFSRFSAYLPDLGHPGVLAVAGMVAFLAATVRAPLTGLLLAVEMTAEYQLMMPAALTAMTATAAAEWLGGRPIYSVLLERAVHKADNGPESPASPASPATPGAAL